MDGFAMRRRQLLASAATLPTALIAGCLGDREGTGQDRTDTTVSGTATAGSNRQEIGSQTVSFEAPHGATLSGTLYGNGECGIVLVPQINMDRESWQPQAEWLASFGYTVLAIDEDPDDRPASVQGAIQYLQEQQSVSNLVLIGASSGGEAVVIANANAPPDTIDGTITLSAGGGVEAAGQLQGRLLFVVSQSDDDRFVRTAKQLHQNASQPKELVQYRGTAHGQRLFESGHREELKEQIRTLITKACGN